MSANGPSAPEGSVSSLTSALKGLGRLGSAPSATPWTAQSVADLRRGAVGARTSSWSEEQAAVLASTASRLRVVALAGTGKTELLSAYADRRRQGRWRYVVFNRSMAQEAAGRMPNNVSVTTLHGLAFSRFGAPLAHKSPLPWGERILDSVGLCAVPDPWRGGAVALLRATVDAFSASSDEEIAAHHVPDRMWRCWQAWDGGGSIWSSRQDAAHSAARLWAKMLDPASSVPAVPECWLKRAQLEEAVWPCDGWLVDEAQDLSPAMWAWLQLQPGQRITVGDPHQALYGWRTPLAWGVAPLAPDEALVTLTHSFRFGAEIAEIANGVLARMGVASRLVGKALPGHVRVGQPSGPITALARTQAGAAAGARRAQGQGWSVSSLPAVPARWSSAVALREGRRSDITDPWVAGFSSFADLEDAVVAWGDSDGKRACKWARRPRVAPHASSAGPSLSVSTVHQAKGAGFDRVWLWPDFRLPAGPSDRWSARDAEAVRVLYVALTRARSEMWLAPELAQPLRDWSAGGDVGAVPESVWDDGF